MTTVIPPDDPSGSDMAENLPAPLRESPDSGFDSHSIPETPGPAATRPTLPASTSGQPSSGQDIDAAGSLAVSVGKSQQPTPQPIPTAASGVMEESQALPVFQNPYTFHQDLHPSMHSGRPLQEMHPMTDEELAYYPATIGCRGIPAAVSPPMAYNIFPSQSHSAAVHPTPVYGTFNPYMHPYPTFYPSQWVNPQYPPPIGQMPQPFPFMGPVMSAPPVPPMPPVPTAQPTRQMMLNAKKRAFEFVDPTVPQDFKANPNNHGRWQIDEAGNRHYLNAPKVPRNSRDRKK